MVEPTESEDLAELDRFCDAMIAIRDEIRARRARGVAASRTARCATRRTRPPTSPPTSGTGPYSRDTARVPGRRVASADKYWPPVSRIDDAYGDRNVMCACPPIEAYDSNPEA